MRMRLVVWIALVAGILVAARPAAALTYLYQFFAFSAEDLEINPGPTMSVHGRIHANGDLYLNSNPGPFLLGDDPASGISVAQATAGGRILRGRKFDDACLGTVQIDAWKDDDHDGSLDPLTLPCTGSITSVVPAETLAAWNGALADGTALGSVPGPEVLARDSGIVWQLATLRIGLMATTPDANGRLPIVVLDAAGAIDPNQTARLQLFMTQWPSRVFYNDVPKAGWGNSGTCSGGMLDPAGAANTYCNKNAYVPVFNTTTPGAQEPMYACPASSVGLYPCGPGASGDPIVNPTYFVRNSTLSTGGVTARRAGFFNNRENAWVRMLNVNVHDLIAWNALQPTGNQLFPPDLTVDGGLVLFLTVVDAGSAGIGTPRLGVRVLGSPGLGQTGVTIVSDQALYVEGNYNTGMVAGEPWRPSALLGDTINVLSSSWESTIACRNDCQSRQPLASRPVTANTTINAALVGGLDRTSVGNYNGGVENFPRLHESWTARTLTFRGSIASLGPPVHASGAWCGTGTSCNIYNPPARNWDFDAAFLDPAKLPPLTPQISCGDGIVDFWEECDDGNTVAGDCCSPTCQAEPAGSACADDGNACSLAACDGAGSCAHTPSVAGVVCRSAAGDCDAPEACDGASTTCPADIPWPDGTPCDDGDVCTVDACVAGTCVGTPDPCDDGDPCTRDACAAPAGCTHDASPATTCRTAASGAFQIAQRDGTSTSLRWTWTRGDATTLADLGDPLTRTGYALCVSDAAGPVLGIGVPPGASHWSAQRAGFRYRDAAGVSGGIVNLSLGSGAAGKARIALTGRGAALPDPDLSRGLAPPVVVQLRRADADVCWDATYQPGDVRRNDGGRFQARRR